MHRKFFYDSNQITNTDSATLVLAMRQACKNILYTVANSGNYTVEDPNAVAFRNFS
jgi:beta-glucosidase